MFTGIVEEIGTVKNIVKKGKTLVLTIGASEILEDVHLGDSISVNGVCLTVTNFTKNEFSVDVMPETFQASNLSTLVSSQKVNLERAMAANGRFGGHIVSGHIDGTGKIVSIKSMENAVIYKINIPSQFAKYCLQKGSITIDGTSLTIFEVETDIVTISLIPHTRSHTIIGSKKVGDVVNIEFDLLGKYVEKMLGMNETKKSNAITTSFLTQNGYI
ncbi:riboflavin synthase subunit alpha [Bacillus sp. FJAT-25509]|uniref:riboflavin synthase n=1 Tax=Bacillaceae TaxID=186817 RepID=UPI0006F78486|nr:riboflavin synthase [Bacillus sp. FJAT-25509]KQL39005.1 riboflavin synthase subunit alpha [Bacillus sp. FJAT-25509]